MSIFNINAKNIKKELKRFRETYDVDFELVNTEEIIYAIKRLQEGNVCESSPFTEIALCFYKKRKELFIMNGIHNSISISYLSERFGEPDVVIHSHPQLHKTSNARHLFPSIADVQSPSFSNSYILASFGNSYFICKYKTYQHFFSDKCECVIPGQISLAANFIFRDLNNSEPFLSNKFMQAFFKKGILEVNSAHSRQRMVVLDLSIFEKLAKKFGNQIFYDTRMDLYKSALDIKK